MPKNPLTTAGTAVLFLLSTAAGRPRAQDPGALAARSDVVFLKVAAFFDPDQGRLREGPLWVALRGQRVAGVFAAAAVEALEHKSARLIDVAKEHPKAVLVPGFVDARSFLFLGPESRSEKISDPSVEAKPRIQRWRREGAILLRSAGVTAVFVPASAAAERAGPGALVRSSPSAESKVLGCPSLFLRLASPTAKGTNLDRDKVLATLKKLVREAEAYGKKKEAYEKARQEYEKALAAYIAWYRQRTEREKATPIAIGIGEGTSNSAKKGGARSSAQRTGARLGGPRSRRKPAPERRAKRRGRRIPRLTPEIIEKIVQRYPPKLRDRIRKQLLERMRRQQARARAQRPKQKPATKPASRPAASRPVTAGAQAAQGKPAPEAAEKPPARPKRPKPVPVEPAKEAMLAVLHGKRTLRIEIHRAAAIRALLAYAKEKGLGKLVLVGATEAWRVAPELRRAGVRVVVRARYERAPGLRLLPEHAPALAAALAKAGVGVAFASEEALPTLTLTALAARAVACGMPTAQALLALSKTAYETTGRRWRPGATGWVLWSEDPLAPAARPLGIVAGGRLMKFEEGAR